MVSKVFNGFLITLLLSIALQLNLQKYKTSIANVVFDFLVLTLKPSII